MNDKIAVISSTQANFFAHAVSTKNHVTNTNFPYDNAGNLTFDGLYNYTWDAENPI